MHTFKYDEDGDWVLNELVAGDEQLTQNLKHLLRTAVGEWMFNEQHGFRRSIIEQKIPDKKQIVQAMHDCLYQEPRVAEVLSVEYDFNRIKRRLTIDFRARAVNGNEIGGEAIVNQVGI
ncbi:hypothetical protein [Lysinibacillus piscis]|uniref:DUF2634 domain-containing protein n=1 Tax=Lysinibacillus piscis TaxID=2518931 RepID=A0ABQ5NJ15_9BACI|nr:hypothetical protein [Lysinibacillus sp. KH24]GLC88265.1 hypothetical protein LYSBPC_13920 [Lysinibacillus sp. KH24]